MDFLQPDIKHERQPGEGLMLWLPVFLGMGAALYFILSYEPSVRVICAAFVMAVVVTGITRRFSIHRPWRYAVAFLLLLPLGMGLSQFRTHQMDTQLLTRSSYNATVSGDIQNVERTNTGWRVLLRDAFVDDDKTPYVLRVTIRRNELTPIIGGHMTVKASLMPPSPPLLPGMYDFQQHAFFQRISGYGYATKVLDYTPPVAQDGINLEAYRLYLAQRVYQNLPQPEAGITTALLNGQRGGIARKTTQSLQQSGLFHIISISGLHVALMAGIVFYLVRLLLVSNMRIALTWPVKKIAAAFALVAIILFMLVVGSDPATLRSVIMASIALVAVMLDREAINLRLVALAALVIIVFRPESVLDIGFQLSFAAVSALVAFYNYSFDFWQHKIWKERITFKLIKPVLGTIVTSIVATLATAPLVFLNFQQLPVLSMLSNALAMPVVAFIIMPGTFFTYLTSAVPFLGNWVIHYMGFGVTLLLMVSDFTTALPLAVWRVPAIPVLPALLVMTGFFLLIVCTRYWRFLAVLPIITAVILFMIRPTPDLFLTGNRLILLPVEKTLQAEGKTDSFSRNLFLQFTAQKTIGALPCGGDICTLQQKGKSIRILRTVESLKQACDEKADLVLTRYYLDKPCIGTMVIDRHTLDRHGGVAITLDPLHYTPVYAHKTRRPWQKPLNQGWNSRVPGVKLSGNDKQTAP